MTGLGCNKRASSSDASAASCISAAEASLLAGWPTSAWMALTSDRLRLVVCCVYLRVYSINLLGWPFRDAWFSFLRPQPPPGSSAPPPSCRRRASSPEPPRRPAAGAEAADGEPCSDLLSGRRGSRRGPRGPKTASAARTWCRRMADFSDVCVDEGPTETMWWQQH